MNCATVLVVGYALASGTVLKTVLPLLQETPEAKRAIVIVTKADGTIVFDEKAPGKPVIGVNL
jgi:short subunit fatty acids transporter